MFIHEDRPIKNFAGEFIVFTASIVVVNKHKHLTLR